MPFLVLKFIFSKQVVSYIILLAANKNKKNPQKCGTLSDHFVHENVPKRHTQGEMYRKAMAKKKKKKEPKNA